MDIVRITLNGYGCETARGIITKELYNELENSDILNDIWVKGLYNNLGDNLQRIDLLKDYGIIDGDLTITVNEDEVLDIPTSVLDSINISDDFITKQEYQHPKTKDIVMTTVQYHSGIIGDIMFITNEEFDLGKLKFITKDIHNEDNEVIIKSLISEIYYDDVLIPFSGSETDLRMSNIYFTNTNYEER